MLLEVGCTATGAIRPRPWLSPQFASVLILHTGVYCCVVDNAHYHKSWVACSLEPLKIMFGITALPPISTTASNSASGQHRRSRLRCSVACPRCGGDGYPPLWRIGVLGATLTRRSSEIAAAFATRDDSIIGGSGGQGRSSGDADIAKGRARGGFWGRGRVFIRLRRCC